MDSVCGPVPDELRPGSVSFTLHSQLYLKEQPWDRHHLLTAVLSVLPFIRNLMKSSSDIRCLWVGLPIPLHGKANSLECPLHQRSAVWLDNSHHHSWAAVLGPIWVDKGLDGRSLPAETLLRCSMRETAMLPCPPPYCGITSLHEKINSTFLIIQISCNVMINGHRL